MGPHGAHKQPEVVVELLMVEGPPEDKEAEPRWFELLLAHETERCPGATGKDPFYP